MAKHFNALLADTGIHGTDQLTSSSKRIIYFVFWIIVLLILVCLAGVQIYQLSITFAREDVVSSNQFEEVDNTADFVEKFQPVYCSQGWLDTSKVTALRIRPVALILAAEDVMSALDYFTYENLVMLMTEEDKSLVYGMGSLSDKQYYQSMMVDFSFSREEGKAILSKELVSQNVSTAMELLKLVTTYYYHGMAEDKHLLKSHLGSICRQLTAGRTHFDGQIYQTKDGFVLKTIDYINQTSVARISMMFMADRLNNSAKLHASLESEQLPPYGVFHKSIEAENVIDVEYADSYRIIYSIQATGRVLKRVQTKKHKCFVYPNMYTRRLKLKFICSYGCLLDNNFDMYNHEYFQKFSQSKALTDSSYFENMTFMYISNDTKSKQSDFEDDLEYLDLLLAEMLDFSDEDTKTEKPFVIDDEISKTTKSTESASSYVFTTPNTNSKPDIEPCRTDCDDLLQPCEHRKLTLNVLSTQTLDVPGWNVGYPDSHDVGTCEDYGCIVREFHIDVEQYLVVTESKMMTIPDFIGAIGGSFGFFMGASVVSFIQLFLNGFIMCCGVFKCCKPNKDPPDSLSMDTTSIEI